jgi:hypothetical protein
MRARAAAALAVALVLAATPAPAGADEPPLAEAQRFMEEVRFDKARESLDGVLRQGTSDPAGLAAIYRLRGEVSVALGDSRGAREAFSRWLMIDPAAALPAGTSPKIVAAFDATRAALADKPPLRVRATPTPRGSVLVVVESDPLELVRGARASYARADGAPRRVEGAGRGRIELLLPAEAPLVVQVAAIDLHGNALRLMTVERPATRPAAVAAARTAAPPPPWYARWYPWAGAAALSGAATVYFGLEARSDQEELDAVIADSGNHSYDEARDIEERGDRHALLANVGAAVTGGLAVVSGILYLRGRHGAEPPALQVAPSATPDSAALLIEGHF